MRKEREERQRAETEDRAEEVTKEQKEAMMSMERKKQNLEDIIYQ